MIKLEDVWQRNAILGTRKRLEEEKEELKKKLTTINNEIKDKDSRLKKFNEVLERCDKKFEELKDKVSDRMLDEGIYKYLYSAYTNKNEPAESWSVKSLVTSSKEDIGFYKEIIKALK